MCIKYIASVSENQDAVLASPAYIPHIFLNLILGCTYQHAESGLISIIRFAEIRTDLVLMLHFAGSNPDKILSLGTGEQLCSQDYPPLFLLCQIKLLFLRMYYFLSQHSQGKIN